MLNRKGEIIILLKEQCPFPRQNSLAQHTLLQGHRHNFSSLSVLNMLSQNTLNFLTQAPYLPCDCLPHAAVGHTNLTQVACFSLSLLPTIFLLNSNKNCPQTSV